MSDVDINSLKSRTIPPNIKPEDAYLNIDIKSRKKQYFKGQAHTLTSINETGEFDVLPYHANFITLIKDFIILDSKKGNENKIDIDTGVLSVQDNIVQIYLDL
jgi:F0F1-type ATP synthase epsilon subunit